MFKLHPILSNNSYKLLKTLYPVATDIHESPNMSLDSHRKAAAWEEALGNQKCFSYGISYGIGEDGLKQTLSPQLFLLLGCVQIANNTYRATVKTLSQELVVNMLSDQFVIEFTYEGDMEAIEKYGKTFNPIAMYDVKVVE